MSLVCHQFLDKTFILKVVEYPPTNFTQFTLMVGGGIINYDKNKKFSLFSK